MKIKINGLDVEFTDDVPTKAGDFYAIDARLETRSMTSDYVSILRVKPVHGVYVVGHLQQFNYLWSAPLVPVTEVFRAYREGREDCQIQFEEPIKDWYDDSRAKRVVEGTL